jgi:hypothetical protein
MTRVIFPHPCKGVKTPGPGQASGVHQPGAVDETCQALEDDDFKLLVEVDIESGCAGAN